MSQEKGEGVSERLMLPVWLYAVLGGLASGAILLILGVTMSVISPPFGSPEVVHTMNQLLFNPVQLARLA